MRRHHPVEVKILYEDDYLIAINKPSGLLSVATDREKDTTAYRLVKDYLAYGNRRAHLFVLHRLDRDTSGILIFAKDKGTQEAMQSRWNEVVTERGYMAIVEGLPEKKQDELRSFITENRAMVVYQSREEKGKLAVTRYRVAKFNDQYSLLKINIMTGRKNQIRVHSQWIGHPIAGDRKYGAQTNPFGRLALHSNVLSFIHPWTGKTMKFTAPLPKMFRNRL